MELRYIMRNGEKVLQVQYQRYLTDNGIIIEKWEDIRTVEEPKKPREWSVRVDGITGCLISSRDPILTSIDKLIRVREILDE